MKYQQMTRNFYVFATLMFTREKGQHSTQLLETPLYKGKELGWVLAQLPTYTQPATPPDTPTLLIGKELSLWKRGTSKSESSGGVSGWVMVGSLVECWGGC